MYICPKCQKTSENAINFCPNCGTPIQLMQPPVEEIPTVEATTITPPVQQYQPPQPMPQYMQQPPMPPQYCQPQYSRPVPPPPPIDPNASMGKATASMVLGIIGFMIALFSIPFMEDMVFNERSIIIALIVQTIAFAMSIVGVSIAGSAASDGNRSAMRKVGKVFGIIGIVFSAIFLGILSILLIVE